jgi:hypothetical protein
LQFLTIILQCIESFNHVKGLNSDLLGMILEKNKRGDHKYLRTDSLLLDYLSKRYDCENLFNFVFRFESQLNEELSEFLLRAAHNLSK